MRFHDSMRSGLKKVTCRGRRRDGRRLNCMVEIPDQVEIGGGKVFMAAGTLARLTGLGMVNMTGSDEGIIPDEAA
jgi:hypothetical protein